MESGGPQHSLLASKCSIALHPHGLLRTICCAFKNRRSGPPSGKKKRGGGGRVARHAHSLTQAFASKRLTLKERPPVGPPRYQEKLSISCESMCEFELFAEILRSLSSSIVMSKSQARIFGLAFVSSWGLKCLQALVERCNRARAITNLAQLVGKDENKIGLMKVMGFGEEGGITDVLRKRCVDEKAAVRKAALVLISKLTTF
uniref:Condensin-2 complex subunit D3 n=1 Tax=Tanacetum cinerariifolium TaxID=118510 RepID=A0A699H470_TANCI|nr:condensin-2 complex subunit D3 [Tanacetum cinerariifolium]